MFFEVAFPPPLAIMSSYRSPSSTISTKSKDTHPISLHQPSPPSQTQPSQTHESQTLLTPEESQEKSLSFADPDSDSSSDSEITKPQRESPRIAALKAKKLLLLSLLLHLYTWMVVVSPMP